MGTEEGIRLRWLFQRRPIRALRVANAVTYLSICLFELPSWVKDQDWSFPAWNALNAPHEDYHTFGLPVLPPFYTMTASLCCLTGFGLEIWTKYRFMGRTF